MIATGGVKTQSFFSSCWSQRRSRARYSFSCFERGSGPSLPNILRMDESPPPRLSGGGTGPFLPRWSRADPSPDLHFLLVQHGFQGAVFSFFLFWMGNRPYPTQKTGQSCPPALSAFGQWHTKLPSLWLRGGAATRPSIFIVGRGRKSAAGEVFLF